LDDWFNYFNHLSLKLKEYSTGSHNPYLPLLKDLIVIITVVAANGKLARITA
jgi:hypothetical protein